MWGELCYCVVGWSLRVFQIYFCLSLHVFLSLSLSLKVTTVRWIIAIMEEHVWRGLARIPSSVSVQMDSAETPATWQRQVEQRGNFWWKIKVNHTLNKKIKLFLPFSIFLLIGPCSPNPCKNDGSCETVSPTRRGDVFNEYFCKCQPGFEGAHCQTSK